METKTGGRSGDDQAPAQEQGQRLREGSVSTEPSGAAANPSSDAHGAATLASLSANLAAQQARVEEIERSLVERIGDVDDDRRRTAVQLQRARQGQEEEVAARLRRQTRLQLGVMAGFAVAVVVLLGLFYWQIRAQARPLAAEADALRDVRSQQLAVVEDVEQLAARLAALGTQVDALGAQQQAASERQSGQAAVGSLDERLQTRIEVLGATLGEVSSTLTRVEESMAAQTERLNAQVQRLDADQQRLADDIASLRNAARSDTTTTREPAAPSAAGGAPQASAAVAAAAPATAGGPAQAGGESASTADAAETARPSDEPSYAVQLVGYFDRERMLAFATRDDLPEPVYYREETYRGRPWYVLIHSLHPSYERAAAALAELPPPLADLDPLIRRLPTGSGVREID